jgi:endonuclease/exonuclease/phosphatase family metal-dependent hydrolase
MSTSLRIASFNVENLFDRSKVLNFKDPSVGDEILEKINEFQKLLKKTTYANNDKKLILALYNGDLKPYIEVREDRGKLFERKGNAVTGVKAKGADEWDGAIEFKRAKFSEVTRGNTARVIKDVRADVACIVEAESRPTLQSFDAELLKHQFNYSMLIDANDPRGIDVGLYSKYPFGDIKTHMFDKDGNKTIFSRDCLEVEILLPNGKSLYMLCNHFKSKGYDPEGKASEIRERQAKRVALILERYDLEKDWVVVAGDLNDNPTSSPLQPLLSVVNMYDVLGLQYPEKPLKRWTYRSKQFEQIDFVLVSKPLRDMFKKAGVERRGIYDLNRLTTSAQGLVDVETQYDTVTSWTNSASDHGAIWAEFVMA